MTLKFDIDQLAADAALMHQVIHGDQNTTVTTQGGAVRSVAKLIHDKDLEINVAANGVLAQSAAQAAIATAQAAASSNDRISAEAARDAANAAWTAALAANPALDPVVRMNPSTITADLTIPSFYNAASTGPLTIGEGVNVTINDNANWSIL